MSDALNALSRASSAYLRTAMHQPIQWHEWDHAAFEKARSENKPVLLDIGAVWCHWCHVMDRESYESAETAEIINREFIAVKVDRDERPDVDSRYQLAVSAISGTGGWPHCPGGQQVPVGNLPGAAGNVRALAARPGAFGSVHHLC